MHYCKVEYDYKPTVQTEYIVIPFRHNPCGEVIIDGPTDAELDALFGKPSPRKVTQEEIDLFDEEVDEANFRRFDKHWTVGESLRQTISGGLMEDIERAKEYHLSLEWVCGILENSNFERIWGIPRP